MKTIKLEKNENGSLEVFKMVLGSYQFAPNQMIRFNMRNPITKESVDMFGIIESLSFDERHGSPCPLANVKFIGTWPDGEESGYMNIKFTPHRYYSGMPTQEELETLYHMTDNPEYLFVVDYSTGDLIFPFDEEIYDTQG